MNLQHTIEYFKALASTPAEELYVEKIFSKDFLSIDEIEFLTSLQEHARLRLEHTNQALEDLEKYLNFDADDIKNTVLQEEDIDQGLTSVLFQEAFELRTKEQKIAEQHDIDHIKEKISIKK